MAIDRLHGSRRVMRVITRHPDDLAADARIQAVLATLPASMKRRLDWHLWDGVLGERAMREALDELRYEAAL